MIRKLFALILIFSVQHLHAQNKRANIWYFGTHAGIDFNSGSPVAITGALVTGEGTAVMCDTSGSLLFYTDGLTVWDRSHNQMPNGFALAGGSSSSQSALIVPDPANGNQYYLFTIAPDATGGLSYSIVDMTLNAGFGDITIKNSPLISPTGEKVTGFQKPGSNDIWIVTHEWGTANFYSYLLTATGLNAPVISTCGQVHTGSGNPIGYMKISPSGDKIAVAVSRNNNFDLCDFDPMTGIVSNAIVLPASFYTYGIEFSRDGKILYAAEFSNKIYQYDLTLGSSAAIIASQLLLQPTPVGTEIGSLQMAPDGRIYVCKNGPDFTGVINNPEILGQGCNYVDTGFFITPNTGQEGLPNFLPSIFTEVPQVPVALFSTPDNHICPGTCTNFTNLSANANSYIWSFPGATPSTSTDINPTNICYNSPGTYAVGLVAVNANGSDTLTLNNFITVYPSPPPQGISQSGDTLFAIAGANSYQWYYNGNLISGATDYFYVAMASGDYNVVATDVNDCEVEAVIFDVIAGIHDVSTLSELQAAVTSTGALLLEGSILYGAHISIYNIPGEKIYSSSSTGSTFISLDGYAPGLYIVEVVTGKKTLRIKFIKPA